MDAREERLAKNEILFRAINERIEQAMPSFLRDDRGVHVYEFLCECSNRDCTRRLKLRRSDYEHVRRRGDQFAVAPRHDLPEMEEVVFRTNYHQVVRKQGTAAEVAEEHNPR